MKIEWSYFYSNLFQLDRNDFALLSNLLKTCLDFS